MAYKCKHCGYEFKDTDSDLCPECFTARDDINCTDLDKDHDHEKDDITEATEDFVEEEIKSETETSEGSDTENDDTEEKTDEPVSEPDHLSDEVSSEDPESFVEKEIRSESALTKEQISERAADIMDNLKKRFSDDDDDLPPDAFDTPSEYSEDMPMNYDPSSVDILNGNGGHHNRNTAAIDVRKIRIISLIIIFAMLIGSTVLIASGIKSMQNKKKNNAANAQNSYKAPSAESNTFVITADDTNLSLTINSLKVKGHSGSLNGLIEEFEPQILSENFDPDADCSADLIYADFALDNISYKISDITVKALSGNSVSYTVIDLRTSTNQSFANSFPIYVTDLNDSYNFTVTCTTENDEKKLDFNISYKEIIDHAKPLGNLTESVEEAVSEGFDYSYSKSPFKASLRDINGNNAQIIRGRLAYEIAKEDPTFEKITLNDDQLKSSEWALYEIKLVYADTSHSPIECVLKDLKLEAYDTNNTQCYSYSSNEFQPDTALLIPICKKVQYFKIVMTYDDAKGAKKETEIHFDLNGLDNSK